MLAKFNDIVFYALSENKKTILKSTIRPIEELETKRFGILSGKYAFKFHVWYLADTIHERSRIIKPKYIAWLDQKKKPIRFAPINNREAMNPKYNTVEFDGIIKETT